MSEIVTFITRNPREKLISYDIRILSIMLRIRYAGEQYN